MTSNKNLPIPLKMAKAETSWENRLATNCQPHIHCTIFIYIYIYIYIYLRIITDKEIKLDLDTQSFMQNKHVYNLQCNYIYGVKVYLFLSDVRVLDLRRKSS